MSRDRKFRSLNEEVAYKDLRLMFPNTVIEHDFHLKHGLKIDFLVRSVVSFGIEIDGEQHYNYCARYHRDKKDFDEQKRRDKRKDDLCRDQGIPLLRIDARGGLEPGHVLEQLMVFLDGVEIPEKKYTKQDYYKNKNKEYRQLAYKRMKEYKKNRKETNHGL